MAQRTVGKSETSSIGHNSATLERVAISTLRKGPKDPRRYSQAELRRAKPVVAKFKDHALPIAVGKNGAVLYGEPFVEAARELGISHLLVTRQESLDEQEQLLFSIATNKILSLGSWDGSAMDAVIREFEQHVSNFSSDLLGFAPGELDKLLGASLSLSGADDLPTPSTICVSKPGSLWLLNNHRLLCGDATDPETMAQLMEGKLASAAICDPPFGCKIDGFVSKRGKHADFLQAAGEMDADQLQHFFHRACLTLRSALAPGSLVYLFIDWRSLSLLQTAAEAVFGKIINLCVWSKDRAGMGSFYRSRHELILVLAVPGAKHRNNVELGQHGRDRSNVWEYPCAASSRRGREGDILKLHPTPKSVEMIADAMLDCSARGEIIIDSFLGSGTALLAAERSGRSCYGLELAPHFVDVAVRRWQNWTGKKAIDNLTGGTFDELATELQKGGQA